MTSSAAPLVITLLSAPRKCAKCVQCEALVQRLQERFPGQLEFRHHTTEDPEAAPYGVIMTPLLAVGNFVAAMGSVPDEEKLAQLITRKLEQA